MSLAFEEYSRGGIHIHGVILAAGLGERMRPLTEDIPKALLKVGGKTLVDWTIERLTEVGIDKIVVAVGWKGHQLEDHLSSKQGVTVIQVPEFEIGPLQTLVTAIESFNDDFLLTPVDIISEPGVLSRMVAQYKEQSGSKIMMLAVDRGSSKGTPVSLKKDRITGLGDGTVDADTMGRSAMLFMGNSSISAECKLALDEGETRFARVLDRWVHEGQRLIPYWVEDSNLDLDTLSDLLKADSLILERGAISEVDHIYVPSGDTIEVGDSLPLRSNITFHKGTQIIGPVLISPGCVIGEGCRIGPSVSLDSYSRVMDYCVLSESIVLGESTIQAQSNIRRTIVYNSKQYCVD